MRRGSLRSFVAIGATAALVLAACSGGKSSGGGTDSGGASTTKAAAPITPNTLVFGAEQEPPALNNFTNAGNTVWTANVTTPVLSSLTFSAPDLSYQPGLLTQLPTLVSESPQTVRYTIRPEAVWDDGTPITADDVQYTLTQILNDKNDIVSREGYDKIPNGQLSNVSADKKTFDISFIEKYAPWREIFNGNGAPILEAAKMQGKDFNTALNDEIPFASGPFKFASWSKGQDLRLVKNDKWWGAKKPALDGIVFKFMEEADTQIKSLQAGEVQAIYPQPQTEIVAQLKAIPDAQFTILNGLQWEHIDFNNLNPILKDPLVRQALIYMIDREAIVTRIAKPVDPNATVLQNVIYVQNQPQYKADGWTVYSLNLEKASGLLQTAGWTKSNGVWTKDGKPLELTISTTAGNKARELTQQILVEAFKAGGVKLNIKNAPADELFKKIPECDYEIALFAYSGGTDPVGAVPIYSANQIPCVEAAKKAGLNVDPNTKGGQNTTAFVNEQVTNVLNQTSQTLDPTSRTALFNQANVLIAQGAPTLPLYQKPNILAHATRVTGMQDNPTNQGPCWNSQDWVMAAK